MDSRIWYDPRTYMILVALTFLVAGLLGAGTGAP